VWLGTVSIRGCLVEKRGGTMWLGTVPILNCLVENGGDTMCPSSFYSKVLSTKQSKDKVAYIVRWPDLLLSESLRASKSISLSEPLEE
jgi:hypothetical protein